MVYHIKITNGLSYNNPNGLSYTNHNGLSYKNHHDLSYTNPNVFFDSDPTKLNRCQYSYSYIKYVPY